MDRAAVVETHISVLFFVGDRVYKLRKKVTTPFLDFSTRQRRLADCQREVALNSRLAPDVYLGVMDVVDAAGAPVDHLVVMRRLPVQRRLAAMVADPAFDTAHLVRIAKQVAGFHERADRSAEIDRAGSEEHLRMLWTTNLDETAAFAGSLVSADILERIRRAATTYLDGRLPLLAGRVSAGRIVDGHGDLLAEDIFCLDDAPRILDCIEFDARFRWGDVLYDTAFLAMDLERLGRPDLARAFLDAYREFTAESHPRSLEEWYVAYRALVRAKIACLRAAGGDATAVPEATAHLHQADRHLDEATVRLVLVGGLPGTGKSTLASAVSDRLGWALLRTDEVRKDLMGIRHSEHAYAAPFEGIYSPEITQRAYNELLRRARVALSMGDSVVLDASWLDPGNRDAARSLAAQARAELHELCCVVSVAEAGARIEARAHAGRDASDATPVVLASLAARAPVPWAGSRSVDTSLPPDRAADSAVAIVRPGLSVGSGPGPRS